MFGVSVNGRSLFLYLSNLTFAQTWVNGGRIPLYPASKYRSAERRGIYTPDEVSQISYGGSLCYDDLNAASSLIDGITDPGSLVFENVRISFGGEPTRILSGAYDHFLQDSLILCFSDKLSDSIMRRLSKSVVVKIRKPAELLKFIDNQLGCHGKIDNVDYTISDDRNHFLKSEVDKWQREVRMLWLPEDVSERWVAIPSGTAKLIDTRNRF